MKESIDNNISGGNIDGFLGKNGINDFSLVRLAGDASVRKYYRVVSGGKSCVLCHDPSFENVMADAYPFLIVHELFKGAGIPVPEIYSHDSVNGFILMQDLGDRLLEDCIPEMDHGAVNSLYYEIIDIMAKIHGLRGDSIPFRLEFDVGKLIFEFDFFIEHALLNYFSAGRTADIEKLRSEFIKISEILYKPGLFVLNHRDFHSRNIMMCGGRPYIIDFQDARMGLPQYDLVSLLQDSYIPAGAQSEKFHIDTTALKSGYYNLSFAAGIHGMSPDEFDYYYDIMAFQRNVKAVGTFAFQSGVKGKKLYERYIPLTLGYLGNYSGRRSELAPAHEIISRLAGEAM
jgi:aminoglycoside/choline kinase family phosphotransferase